MDYYDVLANVHHNVRPKIYLEIGVGGGRSLSKALPPTRIISIDPLHSTQAQHHMTSDEFFAKGVAEKVLEENKIDLAFIDGLHEFRQVMRDFVNVARFSHPRTMILIHDTLPTCAAEATNHPIMHTWAGDVWKLLWALEKWGRGQGFDVQSLNVPPTGLTMVTDITSEGLEYFRESVPTMLGFFQDLTFQDFQKERGGFLIRSTSD